MTFPKVFRKKKHKTQARTKAMQEYMAEHPFDEAIAHHGPVVFKGRGLWSFWPDDTRIVECHHITGRKLKEQDAEWNFLALCKENHAFYHRSWREFIKVYPHLAPKVLAARERMHRRTE